MTCISSLEQYCSQTCLVFASATNVSGEPNLNHFLVNELNTYLEEGKSWIRQFKSQIDLVEVAQDKIQANVVLLSESFEGVRSVDCELFNDKLDSLYKEYLNLGQPPQTYEECQILQNKIQSIKDKLLNEISSKANNLSSERRSVNISFNFEPIKEDAWSWIRWGISPLLSLSEESK